MIPCWPLMSNAAWRRFIGTHPHWHAPQTAPCGGKAAIAKLLGTVALGGTLAVGGAAVGYHAPDYIASLPPVAQCCAWQSGGVVPAALFSPGFPRVHAAFPSSPVTELPLPSVGPVLVSFPGQGSKPVNVPEPSSLLIFGAAVVLVVAIKRRR